MYIYESYVPHISNLHDECNHFGHRRILKACRPPNFLNLQPQPVKQIKSLRLASLGIHNLIHQIGILHLLLTQTPLLDRKTMAESEIKITRIDPDGDVTLELSGPDGKSSLLVSSKALSLASPVFKAMFGSRFKEGLSNLSTTGKAPIPLPDDDMEAFTILCKIIHHQTNEIPRKLTLNCLESLATISDKYDCTKTLAPWGNTWLHSKIDYVHEEDHNKLLAVALVLDWPEPFSRISWDIILMHVGSFLAMPGLTDNSLVKYDLLGM